MVLFASFLPDLGPLELVVLTGFSRLLFGNRLPDVLRSLGESVTKFRKSNNGPDGPFSIP
jgi:sec-independent protein translocase protein TatA